MPKAISYTKGSIVYFEGDIDERIFILKQGQLVIMRKYIETQGTESELLKSGEFFGIRSAIGHVPREETVTALSECQCLVLSIPEFEALFSSNKQLMMKMLKVFSGQLRQVHKKIDSVLKLTEEPDLQEGMMSVARVFFEDERWQSCVDLCQKLSTLHPEISKDRDFLQMSKTANANLIKYLKENPEESYAPTPKSNSGVFSLPAFKRFSKTYNDGQVIIAEFEKGETFYLIEKGTVQLTKCVNGMNKNLDILKPGEIFGEMAILDNSPRSATCVARGKVDCLEFNKANFEILITGNPQIGLILLKSFCKRVYDQNRRFKILTLKDNQAKIADVFCMFDEMNPIPNPMEDKRKFNLKLTDVAHWAGLSIDETRDEINKLVASKRIEVFDDYIVIPRIREMKRIVDTKSMIK